MPPLDSPMSIEVHEKVLAMIKDIAYCLSKINASPAEKNYEAHCSIQWATKKDLNHVKRTYMYDLKYFKCLFTLQQN